MMSPHVQPRFSVARWALGWGLLLALPVTAQKTHRTEDGVFVVISDYINLDLVDQWPGHAKQDRSLSGKPLSIGRESFGVGIGTRAPSRLVLKLGGGAPLFRAVVGVDDAGGAKASVRFTVTGDGRELWNSGVMKRGEEGKKIDLDTSGVQTLVLKADDGGDGSDNDLAIWANARLIDATTPPEAALFPPEEEGLIRPGERWRDTSGKPIQAHGGGILAYKDRYYWYGEDRSNGYIAIGVSGYVSYDLVTWAPLGLVLPRESYWQRSRKRTICERPKVMFNPATHKFVMWFHYDKSGYGDSQAGVAIADRPEGPFRYLGQHRPIPKSTFRDMGVFVDDDKKAYVFYAGEENQTMHVVRLNDDWTEEEKPMVEGETWARIHIRRARESPAAFKYDGKYYLYTSGTTGWNPNPADLSVADHVLGPYTSLGNPCSGDGADKTFGSQNTWILPEPGAPPGRFIYMGDRWKPKDLADSRYVWLPFRIENGKGHMTWMKEWRIGGEK